MKQQFVRLFTLVAAVTLLSIPVMETKADARAGGGRSLGSRGMRSYSRPASPAPSQSPQRQPYAAPSPSPFSQQAGGGFLRSMAGGLMGGILGSMLFSSFAGASSGVGGSGGIGLFEIVLLAGIGYLVYRLIRKKREERSSTS